MDSYHLTHSALFFSYDLRPDTLHFACNQFKQLQEFVANDDIIMIGIDTETKPCRRKCAFNKTSIIQLALRQRSGTEQVFIVDLLALTMNTLKELDDILGPLFMNSNIMKLGHGLVNDFKQLTKSYPTMSAFASCVGIVDTNTIMRKLNPSERRDYSLKYLTEHFLHFNLDKACQMSDWSKRPLTARQLHYAACDALVLLRIIDVVNFELIELQGKENSFTIDSISVDYHRDQPSSSKRAQNSFHFLGDITPASSTGLGSHDCVGIESYMEEFPVSAAKRQRAHLHFDSDDGVSDREITCSDVFSLVSSVPVHDVIEFKATGYNSAHDADFVKRDQCDIDLTSDETDSDHCISLADSDTENELSPLVTASCTNIHEEAIVVTSSLHWHPLTDLAVFEFQQPSGGWEQETCIKDYVTTNKPPVDDEQLLKDRFMSLGRAYAAPSTESTCSLVSLLSENSSTDYLDGVGHSNILPRKSIVSPARRRRLRRPSGSGKSVVEDIDSISTLSGSLSGNKRVWSPLGVKTFF